MYFGNIGLGRNLALVKIADALGRINPEYRLQVYSTEQNEAVYGVLQAHPNIDYRGGIPYSEVQQKLAQCDIYVAAESFREEDLAFTRYSLSTKAADGLACGAAVFAFGPEESGLIDYLRKTGAAQVCTEETAAEQSLRQLLTDPVLQKSLYERSAIVVRDNHTVEGSTGAFENVIKQTLSL